MKLSSALKAVHVPFPYEDVWRVLRKTNVAYPGVIPDLDMFLYDVFGHAAGLKKLLAWPGERLDEARRLLSRSFLERHPEYTHFVSLVDAETAPALFRELEQSEHLRLLLLELIRLILATPPARTAAAT